MQNAKSYLLLVFGTVCLTASVFAAEDTDLQAKEREALRQKLSELQAQESGSTSASAVKPTSLVSPSASDAETKKQVAARAKAREEAEKAAKAEAEANRKTEAKRKAEQESQAKAEARLKAEQEAHNSAPKAAPAREAETKASPAKATAEAKATEPKKATSPPASSTTAEAKPKAAAASQTAPVFQPIQAPPAKLSADKQQKLAELLHRYEADEITPEEYQTERAKILAQP
jgi:hypothetical protein